MILTKKQNKIKELFSFDEENKEDYDYIIGTDEAGRGPGAGPVFAAAVCFGNYNEDLAEKLSLLNDSKQLSEKIREELYEVIIENCVCFIQDGSVEEIDKKNILNTSLNCMKIACEQVQSRLKSNNTLTLVDGNKRIKNYAAQQKTVVKGDSKSAAIAAASILAKVSRDRFMNKLAQEFPQYDWSSNKGYLTQKHIDAIKKYGPTKWHRARFLRKILEQNNKQLMLFESHLKR